MKMEKKRMNQSAISLERISQALAEDMLDPATELEVVRLALRAAGIDPGLVQSDAQAILREFGVARSSTVHTEAPPTPKRQQRAPFVVPVQQRMTRDQLVARLHALRSSSGGLGHIDAKLREGVATSMSEEELRKLLGELEEALAHQEKDESEED
jgi:hypothetical protein